MIKTSLYDTVDYLTSVEEIAHYLEASLEDVEDETAEYKAAFFQSVVADAAKALRKLEN